MDQEDYQSRLLQYYQLGAYCVLVSDEVEEMLDLQQRADDVGAMLDPTAWIQNKEKLDDDKEITRAVAAFRKAVLKLRERKGNKGQSE